VLWLGTNDENYHKLDNSRFGFEAEREADFIPTGSNPVYVRREACARTQDEAFRYRTNPVLK